VKRELALSRARRARACGPEGLEPLGVLLRAAEACSVAGAGQVDCEGPVGLRRAALYTVQYVSERGQVGR